MTVSIERGPMFTNKTTAEMCANKLNNKESKATPFIRSIIHGVHVPVEIITKEQFYEAKWNELSETWNNNVKPNTLNPIEAFETWINYYDYLTAEQYIIEENNNEQKR